MSTSCNVTNKTTIKLIITVITGFICVVDFQVPSNDGYDDSTVDIVFRRPRFTKREKVGENQFLIKLRKKTSS